MNKYVETVIIKKKKGQKMYVHLRKQQDRQTNTIIRKKNKSSTKKSKSKKLERICAKNNKHVQEKQQKIQTHK